MCKIHPNPFQAESPGLAVVRTVSGQKGKLAPAPPALCGSELSAAASNQQSLTWGLKTKHFMLHFYSLPCFLSGAVASKCCSWLPTSTSPILLGIGPQWTAYYIAPGVISGLNRPLSCGFSSALCHLQCSNPIRILWRKGWHLTIFSSRKRKT